MNQKLRIVIIGYYGKLNAGDDLLQYALTDLFSGHDLLFTSWLPNVDFLNTADLVVIGGGSIWPGSPFFQNGRILARKLRVPFVVLGISAKHLNTEIAIQTKYLIDKALYFHVRDEASRNLIGDERIVVGTDLYWWVDHELPNIGEQVASAVSLNLRTWNRVQWDPKTVFKVVKKKFERVYPFPLHFGSPGSENTGKISDADLLASIGCTHVPKSFVTNCLGHSRLTIAMRFHALLVSIRCGLPTIGFDYHRKTKALFKDNGLQELCVSVEKPNDLAYAIELLCENYYWYQEKIQDIRDRSLRNGALDRRRFESVLKQVHPNRPSLALKSVRKIKRFLR